MHKTSSSSSSGSRKFDTSTPSAQSSDRCDREGWSQQSDSSKKDHWNTLNERLVTATAGANGRVQDNPKKKCCTIL